MRADDVHAEYVIGPGFEGKRWDFDIPFIRLEWHPWEQFHTRPEGCRCVRI
jgi:hypothetical protein